MAKCSRLCWSLGLNLSTMPDKAASTQTKPNGQKKSRLGDTRIDLLHEGVLATDSPHSSDVPAPVIGSNFRVMQNSQESGWNCGVATFWTDCFSSHSLFLLWLLVNKKRASGWQWSPLWINRLTLRTEWATLWPPLTLGTPPSLPAPLPPSRHPFFPLSQYVRVRDESAKWEGTRRGSWH